MRKVDQQMFFFAWTPTDSFSIFLQTLPSGVYKICQHVIVAALVVVVAAIGGICNMRQ